MGDSEDVYGTSDSGPYENRDTDNTPSQSFRDTKGGKALSSAGKSMSQKGTDMIKGAQERAAENANRQTPVNLPSYRKGGKVRKTGPARLHKGEYVVPRGKVKKAKRALKRKGHRGM